MPSPITVRPRDAALLVLALLLSGCSSGRKVTLADYDKIKKGMSQAEVEDALGKGDVVTVDVALQAANVLADKRGLLAPLTLIKWSSGSDAIVAGFSEDGKVRCKACKVPNDQGNIVSAFQSFSPVSITGKTVERKDDPPGAADKPRDLIVGKWECLSPERDKGKILEFKNGTVTVSREDMSGITGKYRFVEDDVMLFTARLDGKITSTVRYRVKVTKDDLTMTDEKSKKDLILKRIP